MEINRSVINFVKDKNLTTPYLLIDTEEIRVGYDIIKNALHLHEVFYSVKANNEKKLIEILKSLGSSFEVSSIDEFCRLTSYGIDKDRILYSPIIVEQDFESIINGVNRIVINNYQNLRATLKTERKFKNLYLRLYFGHISNSSKHTSTIGLSKSDVHRSIKKLKSDELGLAFHVGSNSITPSSHLKYSKELYSFILNLEDRISSINFGGGFVNITSNSLPHQNEYLNSLGSFYKQKFADYHISAEPGRFIVSQAGYLITKVVDKFRLNGADTLRIDCGIYNGLLDVALLKKSPTIISLKKGELKKYDIIGPTNDSFDLISKSIELPTQSIGDILIIPNSGAYTAVLSTNFCGLKRPETYLI